MSDRSLESETRGRAWQVIAVTLAAGGAVLLALDLAFGNYGAAPVNLVTFAGAWFCWHSGARMRRNAREHRQFMDDRRRTMRLLEQREKAMWS